MALRTTASSDLGQAANPVHTEGWLQFLDILRKAGISNSDLDVMDKKNPGALHGRIPAALEEGRLEAEAGVVLSAQTSQVMICGNPEMVADTNAALMRRGLKKNRRREPGHITVENYW